MIETGERAPEFALPGGVRERMPDCSEAGATVIGVSPDRVKDVKKFREA